MLSGGSNRSSPSTYIFAANFAMPGGQSSTEQTISLPTDDWNRCCVTGIILARGGVYSAGTKLEKNELNAEV
jgi:hypothetical protein